VNDVHQQRINFRTFRAILSGRILSIGIFVKNCETLLEKSDDLGQRNCAGDIFPSAMNLPPIPGW